MTAGSAAAVAAATLKDRNGRVAVRIKSGRDAHRERGLPMSDRRVRRCPRCDHDLTVVAAGLCPECGANIALREALHRSRRRAREGAVSAAILTLSALLLIPAVVHSDWHASTRDILATIMIVAMIALAAAASVDAVRRGGRVTKWVGMGLVIASAVAAIWLVWTFPYLHT